MILTLFIASLFGATADWLTTKNGKVVDMDGNEVWLAGCNWFGFNVGTGVFDGVWNCNMHDALHDIANHGFNFLRVPVSTEILLDFKYGRKGNRDPGVNLYKNPELEDPNRPYAPIDHWQLFNLAVKWCKEAGLKIMIDIHSAETHAAGHVFNLWYHGAFTTADFYEALEWVADHFKNDDTILAIDLKNEPHGTPDTYNEMARWDDSTLETNWKMVAETAAKKVLAKNPHLLIMVEGIEAYPKDGKTWSQTKSDYYYCWWGGNLRGVKDHPLNFGAGQAQLVYSPHDYGPLVFEQPWFNKTFNETTLYEDCWKDNWAFIMEAKTAPLLIGEWGGFMDRGKNQQWMGHLRDYIARNKIHHTFWCFNANSADTGGLVLDDFVTWDMDKYNLIKPTLWQVGGKFVGLSHTIKLGTNGITLTDLYGAA